MAIYRKINTNFWSDPFICDLPPEKKLFFLYLITNERTKQCGIYDISKRQISFDLSIDLKTVTENIDFFTSHNKIMFSERTNEVAIRNWDRYNGSTSPKVVKCVESELKLIKNRILIDYLYSIDTVSQQEETPTPAKEETPTKEFLLKKETKENFNFKSSLIGLGIKTKLVTDWLKVRKTKRLTNTETAFENLKIEFEKSGKDLNEIINHCVTQSWGGFKASWKWEESVPAQNQNSENEINLIHVNNG